jgi:hypothetical protein
MATEHDVLDRLERMLAAATPGPWEAAKLGPSGEIPAVIQRDDGDWVPIAYFSGDDGEGKASDFDQNQPLIVALRNSAPALIRLARAAVRLGVDLGIHDQEFINASEALAEVRP